MVSGSGLVAWLVSATIRNAGCSRRWSWELPLEGSGLLQAGDVVVGNYWGLVGELKWQGAMVDGRTKAVHGRTEAVEIDASELAVWKFGRTQGLAADAEMGDTCMLAVERIDHVPLRLG